MLSNMYYYDFPKVYFVASQGACYSGVMDHSLGTMNLG